MASNESESLGSEQSIIDQLVEAVEAGEADNRVRFGQELLKGYARHDWHRHEVIVAGILVTNELLDPHQTDRDEITGTLEGIVSEARLERLARGAAMTEKEIASWRDKVLERAFDPELVSHGRANVCVVLQVKHSDRRRAHMAVQNWDGQSGELVAAFSTYSEAINALRRSGTVKMDDGLTWEEQHRNDSR